MTKLKRIKTSINRKGTKQEIHRMKNEIEKQEMKRAIVYITSQERKKKKKSNNYRQQFTTIRCYTSLQKEKDTTTHLERRRNVNYIDRVA